MQSQVKFNRNPEKNPVKIPEDLMQGQVRFNRVLEKLPEKVPEKIMGAFGVESSEVQLGSGEDSGESSGEGREALVQSQIRVQ